MTRAGVVGAVLWCSMTAFDHTGAAFQAPQRPARNPDVNFVPTRQNVADAMLKLARVTASDVVYDLGSGDGRIPILAAQKYGARGVGVELDPKLVELSQEVAREGEVADRVSFVVDDLFTADISQATVVTMYLSTDINTRLEPKLRRELRPGTRIVSHQFRMGSWIPEQTVRAPDGTNLYLWTVPAPMQSAPAELSTLVAKARLAWPISWCAGEFRGGRPSAFAAAIPADGKSGRYVVLDVDATVVELALFTGGAEVSCYSRAEAEKLNATIGRSETIHGAVVPRWNTTVICAFTDVTSAVCWQFSTVDNAFVKIGGWIT